MEQDLITVDGVQYKRVEPAQPKWPAAPVWGAAARQPVKINRPDARVHKLETILDAFIAKELRPYTNLFPPEYYAELFRLRHLEPNATIRPRYFGVLTNDIVYKRLAPGVMEELRRAVPKDDDGRRKAKYSQMLTDTGAVKLREHVAVVLALMRTSADYDEFLLKLDLVKPRYPKRIDPFA